MNVPDTYAQDAQKKTGLPVAVFVWCWDFAVNL